MKIRKDVAATCVYLIIYSLLFWVFKESLPSRWRFDSEVIGSQIDAAGSGSELGDGSYGMAAKFFLLIGDWVDFYVFFIGSMFIIISMKNKFKSTSIFYIFFLTLPCVLLCLMVPSKDSILIMFFIKMYLLYSLNINANKKFLLCLLIYIVYGFFFRSYFLLCGAIVFFMYYMEKNKNQKIYFLIFFPIIIYASYENFVFAMESRDIINEYRAIINPENSKTSLFNYFNSDSIFGFIGNYVFIGLELILPFVFNASAQGIILSLYIFSVFRIALDKKNYMNGNHGLLYFFWGHFFTLIIFEPDLGSFLRHISCNAIFISFYVEYSKNEWMPVRPHMC